jgi:phospholipid/cholesterol/gamma-HCH transport system substrate-binding protein
MVGLQPLGDKLDRLVGEPSSDGIAALVARLNEVGSDLSANSRQLNRVLQMLEESPQSLVFGPPASAPGPGEAGFVAPPSREERP